MPLDKELLDALVAAAPRLDRIFEQVGKPEGELGACATYSRLAVEVLGERGIKAEVRPVYIETANRQALAYLRGKINSETAKKEGARIQVWGDIGQGQSFQHAVCYVPDWDVVVDLAMTQRASKLVPCHPYWAKVGEWPWWLVKFEFKTYPLEYRGYETQPDKVKQAKEYLRKSLPGPETPRETIMGCHFCSYPVKLKKAGELVTCPNCGVTYSVVAVDVPQMLQKPGAPQRELGGIPVKFPPKFDPEKWRGPSYLQEHCPAHD